MAPILVRKKTPAILDVELIDEDQSLLRQCEALEQVAKNYNRKPSFVRFDTDESIKLILNIEAIIQMPSGACSTPLPLHQSDKSKIVVCKEGNEIKIFRFLEEC